MRRIGLAISFAVSLVLPLSAAEAQPVEKLRRIGYLSPGSIADQSNPTSDVSAFRQGLRELGYVEGRNLIIESRYAEGETRRLPSLAAELVRLKVAVIVTWGPGIRAARSTAGATPIVMASALDAVASGYVESLARPGGSVTGLTLISTELMGKRLALLKEALPGFARLALLIAPGAVSPDPNDVLMSATATASKTVGVRLQIFTVRDPTEFDAAFASMTRDRAGALYVVENPLLTIHELRILQLAKKHRLPTMFGVRRGVEAGGLMAYGPNLANMNRRAATFVDKILKGTKPGDIPVEQPTKFELVINLKTVKALGLTIPQSLLVRADEIIQ